MRAPPPEPEQPTIRGMTPQEMIQSDEFLASYKLMRRGYAFLKYGKWGKPKLKVVYLTKDLTQLRWMNPKNLKATGFVWVDLIEGILPGRKTKVMKKHTNKKMSDHKHACSFSIICSNRTVDLEAPTREHVLEFIHMLQRVMRTMDQIHKQEGIKTRIIN